MYVGRQHFGRRGVGDTAGIQFPFYIDPSIPCLGGQGPLQTGQVYCPAPPSPAAPINYDMGGPVAPAASSSWAGILPWALGGLVVVALLRGVSR